MAKPPKAASEADGVQTPPAPSFREVAEKSADAHAEHLEAMAAQAVADAPTAAPGKSAPDAAAPAAGDVDPDDYESWYNSQPEKHRIRMAELAAQNLGQRMAEFYGPEITAILNDVAEDPELKKKLARMSDKQLRQYVFDTALPIYEDPRFAAPAGSDGAIPIDPKLQELETEVKTLKQRDQERETERYLEQRRTEYAALLNTFPELRFQDEKSPQAKRVAAVIERAEELSRKSGKPMSYADVYAEYKTMWTDQAENPPPKAIPNVSKTEVPRPQAPRTKVEARNAMNATLEKYGSLGALQAALKR